MAGDPFAIRLVAYAANGTRLGPLAQPQHVEAAWPLNDVSSMRLDYGTRAVNGTTLAQPREIALEYNVGGTWIEPPGGRFLRIKRGADITDESGARSYECPGYAWLLKKAVLHPSRYVQIALPWPPPDLPPPKNDPRVFTSKSPGSILRTMIDEAKTRGALAGVSVSFTSAVDSAGEPWTSDPLTLKLDLGTDVLATLLNFSEQGLVDWRMRGRTLDVFNPGTAMDVNLALGADPVDLRLGRDIIEASDDATYEEFASAILISADGFTAGVSDAEVAAPWGRWETFQSQSGVTTEFMARKLGSIALSTMSGERVQITRGITFGAARWWPLADYSTGDTVLAAGDGGDMAALRVQQITLTMESDGSVGGSLVLNDRFLEPHVKLGRIDKGIVVRGGVAGGSGAKPRPFATPLVAAKPATVAAVPNVSADEYGYPRGYVTTSWNRVETDVNNVELQPDSYQVYARVDEPGEIWHQIASVDGDETSVTVGPLVAGQPYAFKVRAVTDGTPGDFSDEQSVFLFADAEPPPVPSAPVMSSRLGAIQAAWDGLGEGGVPMPTDFARVRVWMSDGVEPKLIGLFDGPSSMIVADQPYGAARTFWFTSMDRTGNESLPSTLVTFAAQPLVDTDLVGEVINGAHIVDGSLNAADKVVANSITGALIQAKAIQAGHLAANSVGANTLEAILTLSSRIVAGSPTGPRVELNGSGLSAFNAGGAQTVGVTSTGDATFVGEFATGFDDDSWLKIQNLLDESGDRPAITFRLAGTPITPPILGDKAMIWTYVGGSDVGTVSTNTGLVLESGANWADPQFPRSTMQVNIDAGQIDMRYGFGSPGGGYLHIDHIPGGNMSASLGASTREFRADLQGLWADSVFGLRAKTRDGSGTRFPLVVAGGVVSPGSGSILTTPAASVNPVTVNGAALTASVYGGRAYKLTYKVSITCSANPATTRAELVTTSGTTKVGQSSLVKFITAGTYEDVTVTSIFTLPSDGVRTFNLRVARFQGADPDTVSVRIQDGFSVELMEIGEAAIINGL
ncbi:fibronectin type III domain-containing protein [Planotetraspora phitsanulokensis]|uniref:Fibronectin type-III domain-containing protein n=1 Tax=Planotetraspora phitsanulokensis TaxID=575192 RepID=A0A8J3XJ05_9ACTN|nr:fibronectin type III domain-containing protein [Planotetraspora phitsanulokensis]GII42919.1 hypothetical protein Pph01_79220 [Planotetraspora phitsanulokensis]